MVDGQTSDMKSTPIVRGHSSTCGHIVTSLSLVILQLLICAHELEKAYSTAGGREVSFWCKRNRSWVKRILCNWSEEEGRVCPRSGAYIVPLA